ncbi:TorF family putative porin [Luteimonas aquatica]|uniref:TorF family putative porin n=1 Tax=Luteimonas aquatica TaxID=450364 RepID=UPI001F5A48B9|nr:TorF family putative porin [Luteimonas aquatica]
MLSQVFSGRRAGIAARSAACAGLLSCAAPAGAATLAGNATLTTDYVWRGSTQTQGDPAVQAGFRIAGDSGVYGSVWASNVEFAPQTHASSEFDYAIGWAGNLDEDWALDVNVLHYRYPSTATDLNWTELNGTVTWKGNYWASLGWSNTALGYDERGVYGLVGARMPVNERLRFEATLAHYALKDVNGDRRDDDYTHGSISAVWAFAGIGEGRALEVRLTAHGTDSKAKEFFGDKSAGSRIEAALQASF